MRRERDSPKGMPVAEPPDLLQSTVFPKGMPVAQDRRIRPLGHLKLFFVLSNSGTLPQI